MTHSPQLKCLLGVLGPLACSKAYMSGISLVFAGNRALGYKQSYFGNFSPRFKELEGQEKGAVFQILEICT